MTNKPPPVFVVFSSGGRADGIAQLTTNEQRATKYVEVEHACGWDDARAVKYEPAVPRCKTCPRNGLGTCFMFGVPISDDDYCSNHPETKT